MTRRYFTKAHSQDRPVKPPKPPPPPAFEIHRLPDGRVRRYHSTWLARRRGQSRGGLAIARLGLAHRWTRETARKAALKRWRTRNRLNKQLGIRVGLSPKTRERVHRAQLRLKYGLQTGKMRLGIYYDYMDPAGWYRLSSDGSIRPLSERWALTYLGHLGKQTGRVPREVLETVGGTRDAT